VVDPEVNTAVRQLLLKLRQTLAYPWLGAEDLYSRVKPFLKPVNKYFPYLPNTFDFLITNLPEDKITELTGGLVLDWQHKTKEQLWSDLKKGFFNEVPPEEPPGTKKYFESRQRVFAPPDTDPLYDKYPLDAKVTLSVIKTWFPSMRAIISILRREGAIVPDPTSTAKNLKNVDTIAKLWGPKFDKNWDLYMGVAAMLGYPMAPFLAEDLLEAATSLVVGDIEKKWYHGGKWTDVGYYDKWRTVIKGILERTECRVKNEISFEDYVADPDLWGTAGNAYTAEKKFDVTVDGKKARLTKAQLGECVPPETLIEIVRNREQATHKTLLKSEIGKVRLAVNSDFFQYLLDSWVYYRLGKNTIKGHLPFTLAENNQQSVEREIRMAESCKDPNKIKVPSDYSEFDRNISKDENKIYHEEINKKDPDKGDEWSAKFMALSENEILTGSRQMDKFEVKVEEKFKLKVEHGLLSGKYETSQVGSTFNDSWNTITNDALKDQQMEVAPLDHFVQGDDSHMDTYSIAYAVNYLKTINKIGVVVNERKNFLSRDRTEYLRKVYTTRGIGGYAWRALPSLVARKPSNPDEPDMVSEFRSVVGNYATVWRRLNGRKAVMPDRFAEWYMTEKLKVENRDKMGCPVHLGGFGVGDTWDGGVYDEHPKIDYAAVYESVKYNGTKVGAYSAVKKVQKFEEQTGLVADERRKDQVVKELSGQKLAGLASKDIRKAYKDSFYAQVKRQTRYKERTINLVSGRVTGEVTFGSAKWITDRVEFWKLGARLVEQPWSKMLRTSADPEDQKVWRVLGPVARKMGIGKAVDYLTGKLALPEIRQIPPNIQTIFYTKEMAARIDYYCLRNRNANLYSIYNAVRDDLNRLDVARLVWRYAQLFHY